MLRSAQRFRLGGRIEMGLRPLGPGEAPQRCLEMRPILVLRAGQDAAFTFNHDRTGLADRGTEQGNTGCGILARHCVDPFGTGTCLAKATTGADQPDAPVRGGRHLFLAGPEEPVGV